MYAEKLAKNEENKKKPGRIEEKSQVRIEAEIPYSKNIPVIQRAYNENTGRLEGRGERPGFLKSPAVLAGIRRGENAETQLREMGTYHHIIPLATLNKFWNSLIGLGRSDSLKDLMGEVVAGVETNAELAERDDAFAKPAEDGTFAGNVTFAETAAEVGNIGQQAGNREAMQELAGMYQWLPGNLVMGPSTGRKYEPGNGYDDEAAFIKGKARNGKAFYDRLYDEISTFTNMPVNNSKVIKRICDKLKILGKDKPYVATTNKDRHWELLKLGKGGEEWVYKGYVKKGAK